MIKKGTGHNKSTSFYKNAWIFHQKLTLSIDKLCSSNNQLINDWLEKLLMASDESNKDSSIVSDNLLSMQSFATCVINYIQDGSVIAVEFLKVFISIATKLLSSKNGVGFPELMVSSAGYLHTQQLCEESSAKHGPFYVTNIIEKNHSDLIEYNRQTSGGGVSVYYSHALQLLFFSFVQGKNFLCPIPKLLYDASKLHPVSFKINGGNETNNQPLWEWSEVLSHPGLIFCLAQANNNPVVLMVKPNTVLIQEIKIVSTKTKFLIGQNCTRL
ncbi:hypothetical protein CHUAL_009570 [Chamberlinius hualienensis]